MHIRQMQVAHDVVEDRLTLRVATQADEEFRIFLTRRMLRDLWPYLANLVTRPAKAVTHPEEKSPAVDADKQPRFDQAFEDSKAIYPLGMRPLLTTEVTITKQKDETFSILIKEGRERLFRFNLSLDLLQTLCAMLRSTAQSAEWGLKLEYTSGDPGKKPVEMSPLTELEPELVANPKKRATLH